MNINVSIRRTCSEYATRVLKIYIPLTYDRRNVLRHKLTVYLFIFMLMSNILFCFSCTAKFVGEYCQHMNPCYTGPGPRCQNGGSCRVLETPNASPSFMCECPVGYSASLCEIKEENDCDSQPCSNGGTCMLKSLREYQCMCAPGFTGRSNYFIII